MMKPLLAPLALSMLLLSALTGCEAIRATIGTDPEAPTEAATVRILCARNPEGVFIFGPVKVSHADTVDTQEANIRRNRAWRDATKDGALCQ